MPVFCFPIGFYEWPDSYGHKIYNLKWTSYGMQNFEFGMQRILAQWVPGLIETNL